jgi:hypothetical protein
VRYNNQTIAGGVADRDEPRLTVRMVRVHSRKLWWIKSYSLDQKTARLPAAPEDKRFAAEPGAIVKI